SGPSVYLPLLLRTSINTSDANGEVINVTFINQSPATETEQSFIMMAWRRRRLPLVFFNGQLTTISLVDIDDSKAGNSCSCQLLG
ncbi:tRNA(Ile)-lysidine synthase, partial [Clarias magur]